MRRKHFYYNGKPAKVDYMATDRAQVFYDGDTTPIKSCPLELRQTAIRAILQDTGKLKGKPKHEFVLNQYQQKIKAKWKKK